LVGAIDLLVLFRKQFEMGGSRYILEIFSQIWGEGTLFSPICWHIWGAVEDNFQTNWGRQKHYLALTRSSIGLVPDTLTNCLTDCLTDWGRNLVPPPPLSAVPHQTYLCLL